MMNDFENAMKKVADVIHAAARKSGEILESTKTAYNISAEKEKISKLQSKIGAKFYKIYKDGGAVPESIIEELETISGIEETIREMEKTLSDMKPFKFCSECGAKLELSDVYCAKCGAKQHDIDSAKADKSDGCCDEKKCCDEECCDGEEEACDGGDDACCEEDKCCDSGEETCCDGKSDGE